MSRAKARIERLEAMRPRSAGKSVLPFLCGPGTPSKALEAMERRAMAEGKELQVIRLIPASFPHGPASAA